MHMYRIQRITKSLRDYLNFIKYEKDLVAVVRARRKSKHIPQKKANIEMGILNRIKILYKQAVHRFPQALPVWEEYVQFCKVYKFPTDVPVIFDNMLKFHSDKPEVWQKAVMWEHEEAKNAARVKHLIYGGLQRHPKSETLYFTFIKLKLLEAAAIQSDIADADQREQAQQKLLAQTEVIYKEARENIETVEFLVGILEIVSNFEFAAPLEAVILADLQASHRQSELMWHTLARRELAGRHLSKIEEGGATKRHPSDPKKCIELCATIYETACELLDTEQMWSYYLDTLFEVDGMELTDDKVKTEQAIQVAFAAALKRNKVSEECFLKFVEFSSEFSHLLTKDEQLVILEQSTQKFPQSVSLWEMQMRFHIEYQQTEEVYKVFRLALKQLSVADSFPLWELLLLFYKSDDQLSGKVKGIYREAIDLATAEISNKLKPQFLEFLVQSEGIEAARSEYNKLCLCVPSCLEMHRQMARMEAMQGTPSVTAWRKCHEMAMQFFGKENVDVWLEMIKFEKSHGDAKKVSQLYLRAMNTLEKDLVSTFLEAFNLDANQIV